MRRLNSSEEPTDLISISSSVPPDTSSVPPDTSSVPPDTSSVPPDTSVILPDEPSRSAIASNFSDTLFVSAGAGTGKTSNMVRRIISLVATKKARMRNIAAITFTDAAANELRERIRVSLVESIRNGHIGTDMLEELDEAAISTIHSFAKRILAMFPIEAGLPPELSIMDDAEAERDLDDRWKHYIDELLEDESFEPIIFRALTVGLNRLSHLRDLLSDFLKHYDRTEAWLNDPKDNGSVATATLIQGTRPVITSMRHSIETLVSQLRETCSFKSYCSDPSDYLYQHLEYLTSELGRIRSAPDEHSALAMLSNAKSYACAKGSKKTWSCSVEEVRNATREAETQRYNLLKQAREEVIEYLLYRIGFLAHRIVQERAAEGRLCFHDLLVRTRDLLKNNPEVRSAVRNRYTHILIDEFQDTDPLQAEIALLLGSSGEVVLPSDQVAPSSSDPINLSLPSLDPGKLFFVGDAKQSIYRFRRADVGLFNRMSQLADKRVDLQANFRSVPKIVRWINEIFSSLMEDTEISYRPLIPTREELPPEAGPAVTVFGRSHQKHADEVRTVEAAETAALISRMVFNKWQVVRSSPRPSQRENQAAGSASAQWQAATWKDIAVLIPTRTWLPSLTTALEEADIPYRIEAASLLWSTQTVRDLLTIMGAVCNPGEPLATLAALRSPYLACGDDDIIAFHQSGGRLDPNRPFSDSAAEDSSIATGPVASGLARLAHISEMRFRYGPSGLLTQILAEFNGYELAIMSKRPREYWQQLRWLLEQAREFELEISRSSHDFLAWANYQAEKGYQSQPGPLEPDDDAISILTTHGAKGLEFPIVILMGLYANNSSARRTLLWNDRGTPLARIGELSSAGYQEAALAEKELDELEKLRLAYVSMTRARDHLLVSVHHPENSTFRDGPSLAAILIDHCTRKTSEPVEMVDVVEEAQSSIQTSIPQQDAPIPPTLGADHVDHEFTEPLDGAPSPNYNYQDSGGSQETWANDQTAAPDGLAHIRDYWWKKRVQLLRDAQRFPALAATAIADLSNLAHPGSPERQIQYEKGDPYLAHPVPTVSKPPNTAPAIGTAVHSVLHHIDLANPDDLHNLSTLSTAYAIEAGVPNSIKAIEKMTLTALESETIQKARHRPHWKELYVSAPIDTSHGRMVIDGYIDLLYKANDDDLIIVDYKTDSFSSQKELDELVNRYAIQTATYALALQKSMNCQVGNPVLLFINHHPAIAIDIVHLDQLIYKVLQILEEKH